MDFFLFSEEKYMIIEEGSLFEIGEFDYIVADYPSDSVWDLIYKRDIETICRIPDGKWKVENKKRDAKELEKYWDRNCMSITIQIGRRVKGDVV